VPCQCQPLGLDVKVTRPILPRMTKDDRDGIVEFIEKLDYMALEVGRAGDAKGPSDMPMRISLFVAEDALLRAAGALWSLLRLEAKERGDQHIPSIPSADAYDG